MSLALKRALIADLIELYEYIEAEVVLFEYLGGSLEVLLACGLHVFEYLFILLACELILHL